MPANKFPPANSLRYCPLCRAKRLTLGGRFLTHWKPSRSPTDSPSLCPNSGHKAASVGIGTTKG